MTLITDIITKRKALLKNDKGTAAVEFGIILPTILVLLLGAIDMGMYFTKYEITSNALNTITQTLQQDPNHQFTATEISSYGAGVINFNSAGNGNYICVNAYITLPATPPSTCAGPSVFSLTLPPGHLYYIYVIATVQHATVTPLGNFIASMVNIRNITEHTGYVLVGINHMPNCTGNGGLVTSNATGTGFACVPVPNCGNNQMLNYVSGSFTCVNIQSTVCNNPWQQWDAGQNRCNNVPYVLAAGIANPSVSGSGSGWGSLTGVDGLNASGWIQDRVDASMLTTSNPAGWMAPSANVVHVGTYTYINVNDFTLCEGPITFNIPAGLPSGQLVPAGNLVFSSAAQPWHDWAISFQLSSSNSGSTGQFNVCESNGGNWVNGTWPTVTVPEISWMMTWIPTTGPMAQGYFTGNAGTIGTYTSR